MIKAYAQKNNIVYFDYYVFLMVNDKQGLKKELSRDSVHSNIKGKSVTDSLVKEAINKALF